METGLTIGEVATRTGVAVSALHFYERKGLIRSERNAANHRVFPRSIIRRVTVIQIAQKAGITLAEVAAAFEKLPRHRPISARDWAQVSTVWRNRLDRRISLLASLRDELDGCIGCGCLSIDACPLANKDDRLAAKGAGAQLLAEPG